MRWIPALVARVDHTAPCPTHNPQPPRPVDPRPCAKGGSHRSPPYSPCTLNNLLQFLVVCARTRSTRIRRCLATTRATCPSRQVLLFHLLPSAILSIKAWATTKTPNGHWFWFWRGLLERCFFFAARLDVPRRSQRVCLYTRHPACRSKICYHNILQTTTKAVYNIKILIWNLHVI